MSRKLTIAVGAFLLAPVLSAQTLQPPFAGVYVYTDLGSVPGVPTYYGGVVFKAGNPNKMLLGGNANGAAGAIYEIDVVRDSQGFITGFSGTATMVSTAPYIDGGLCYGPGGVLFCTTYNNNNLLQIKPGSSVPDKVIPLGGLV
ncbi:MAG: PEP-CTERM sorting domain-containing protein, partial [Planctomycetes bacterium]|nr:PEP-CTERM sorting domain-containing protein [Planctomycetota bacterium]